MKTRSKLLLGLYGMCLLAMAVYAILTTFVMGKTGCPDLVEALRSGSLKAGSIVSIEVVEPMRGSTPFHASEYAALPRRKTIVSPAEIGSICDSFAHARSGIYHMNHPRNKWSAYLRVNTAHGHYWIYCDVYDDGHRSAFSLDANTLGATNPNGANPYYLVSYGSLLAPLETSDAEEKSTPEKSAEKPD